MIIKLKLTEDHLKLVSMLNIEENDSKVYLDKNIMLRLQSHILDDVAMALGLKDKAIPGTENDEYGCAYPDEVEEYMLSVYHYVSENLFYIETLLHQFATEGVKSGTYKAKDSSLIWERVEDGE